MTELQLQVSGILSVTQYSFKHRAWCGELKTSSHVIDVRIPRKVAMMQKVRRQESELTYPGPHPASIQGVCCGDTLVVSDLDFISRARLLAYERGLLEVGDAE